MATTFGNSDWLWNEAEQLVNNSFNRIIYEVNDRRESVLASLRGKLRNRNKVTNQITFTRSLQPIL